MSAQANPMLKVKRNQGGFTLIETMVAVGVMAIAMIGSLAMVAIGVGRNGSTRMDTTSANVAQTVLEEIASAEPSSNPVLNITDCAGNVLTINSTGPGAKLVPTPPTMAGQNPGDIDFSVAPVAGYQIKYAMCAPNGRQIDYEVRWHIQTVVDAKGKVWGKLVTVAAVAPAANTGGGMYYSPPVTLRTVVGM